MPYSITSFTKILTLAGAPLVVYFSWRPVCEFVMVLGDYILLCPQEESLLPEGTNVYTQSAVQSSKRFKPLSATILLWQG